MKALGVRAIKEARDLAAKHPDKRGSEIIISLCDEIDRLRACKDHANGQLTEDSLLGIGKQYKRTPIHSVPEDYLRWLFREISSNLESLKVDVTLGDFPTKAIALKKLRLHDYLDRHFNEQADENTSTR